MEVIQASIKELDQAAKLFNEYRMFYEQHSDFEKAKEFLKQRIENNESVIYLVVENEHVIGFTQLYPIFSSVSMKRLWLLNDLFVIAEARKKSVGTLLIERAKQLVKETSAKGLILETGKENVQAQRLYKKTGFVKSSDYFYNYTA